MAHVYDLIIVGAGPAGIAASVYAARKKLDFLVLTGNIGGQVTWTADVENYVGFQFITGPDLVGKFEEHIQKYNVPVYEDELLDRIEKKDDTFILTTRKNVFSSRSVILATGKRSKELNVPGEQQFRNKGVAYCATCDGPLFYGKRVAVIGGGNSAMEAALQLLSIADKTYLLTVNNELYGDAILKEKIISAGRVNVITGAVVTSITGDSFVGSITYEKNTVQNSLPVDGVFVEIGLVPNTQYQSGLELNEIGEIKVNLRNETNIPGIFACGDVTDVPEKQIIIAAGEGAKAAIMAGKYLSAR
ncbi:MAG: FAD-dependent oxidoreductase [Candidatus Omnitrophica bacterium]|nr:FAD-dependent oxidoreductase [Candidatus Omnitrophota bacterium]